MTRLLIAAALSTSLFALPTTADAATHCVSTASQLRSLLSTISGTPGGAYDIRIRSGVYTTAAAGGTFALTANTTQSIQISGGWSGVTGTCTAQSKDPSATVLDGGGTGGVLFANFNDGDGGTLTIANLTTRNGFTDEFIGACLYLRLTVGTTALVERVRSEGCEAAGNGSAASFYASTDGLLTVRNSVFAHARGTAAATVQVNAYTNAIVHVLHNTLIDSINSDAGPLAAGASLQAHATGRLIAANNLFWAGDTAVDHHDLHVFGVGTKLYRNHFRTMLGSAATNVAPTHGDPGFVATGNPRLAADSELVDTGVAPPSGEVGSLDFDARTRVSGDAPDVGAFEYAELFGNGFE